jgi:opacity protein-like surface antigen
MKWRVLMLGAAAAALTFGSAASAENQPEIDYNRLGGYYQVSGVYSFADFSGGFEGDPRGGFDVRFGNRLHRHVSVEFQYEYVTQRVVHAETTEAEMELGPHENNALCLPEETRIANDLGERCKTKVTSHHITLNFRAYPWASEESGFFHQILEGRVQPYGMVGIGVSIPVTPKGDAVGFVSRFAAGVDFYATANIVLTLEAAYALSTNGAGRGAETTSGSNPGRLPAGDLDHISIGMGAAYRF